jgi:hypothetical protein
VPQVDVVIEFDWAKRVTNASDGAAGGSLSPGAAGMLGS